MPFLYTAADPGTASWVPDSQAAGVQLVTTTNPGELYSGDGVPVGSTNIGTNETAFSSVHTIPANTLQVGSLLRCRAKVFCPATVGATQLTIRLRLGTGVITGQVAAMVIGPTDVADNNEVSFDMTFCFRTIGATPTIAGIGWRTDFGASNTPLLSDGTAVGPLALDTTADFTASITAQFDTGDGTTARLDFFTVEIT